MKKKGTPDKEMRRASREADLADLRDGRRNRASTFVDRRKEASRRACRNHNKNTY